MKHEVMRFCEFGKEGPFQQASNGTRVVGKLS